MERSTKRRLSLPGGLWFVAAMPKAEPTSRTRLPRLRDLMLVQYGINTALTAWLFAYFALGLEGREFGRGDYWGLLLVYTAVAATVTSILAGIWMYSVAKVLSSLQKALDRGTPAAALRPEKVRRMLTLQRPAALGVLLLWTGAASLWPVVFTLADVEGQWNTAITVAGGVGVGICAAVLSYYAYYRLISQRIAPLLLAEGSLEHLKPFHRTRLGYHFALTVLMLAGVLPATQAILTDYGHSHPAGPWMVYTMIGFVGLYQLYFTMRSIGGPASHLARQMARVRKGDLDAAVSVSNLDTFGQLASDFNAMVHGLRQRDRMQHLFGRYVAQQVVDEIMADRVPFGGERRTATVLFSDIRGFTAMSERMPPEEVVQFLNHYLDIMVECVDHHGGYVDKFIGDAVMAVFGVPVQRRSIGRDACAAVSCALQMSERLDVLNQIREQKGQSRIEIGIGLHTGELVAGSIGSERSKIEYTVIGDTVNLTSRIESLTKDLKLRILLSGQTAALVSDHFAVSELESRPVRGRAGEIRLFTLTDAK